MMTIPGAAIREGASTLCTSRRLARALILFATPAVLLLGGCHNREVAQGAAVYSANCATCHGANGRGQNPVRPWGSIAPEQEGWIAPALDNRGHCYQHTRSELVAIIRDGSKEKGSPMVGFKGRLSDQQIDSVVTYLETLWDRPTRNLFRSREDSAASAIK